MTPCFQCGWDMNSQLLLLPSEVSKSDTVASYLATKSLQDTVNELKATRFEAPVKGESQAEQCGSTVFCKGENGAVFQKLN